MLTISGKALGRKKPLFADFSVAPPDSLSKDGETTLRDLIECVVRQEVAAFRQRQHDRQFLKVLTAKQIEAGVEAGLRVGRQKFGLDTTDSDFPGVAFCSNSGQRPRRLPSPGQRPGWG